MYRHMLAFGDVDVEIPREEGDPKRQAILEVIARLEQDGAAVRRRMEDGRDLARALVSKLHITCHVKLGKLTPELERTLRDELKDLCLESPGFLRWDVGAGGRRPGPDTIFGFTATWATEEQASLPLQRASGWFNGRGMELGVEECYLNLTDVEPAQMATLARTP